MLVSLKDANALVTFKDGSMYYYENVSRRAMLNLMLNKNMSLGFWVNANLVNSDRAVCFGSIPNTTYLTNHWITGLTDTTYLKQQLEYAKEQLMIADDMYSKLTWGNRCDALEAALSHKDAVTQHHPST
jgi:hypothetical protein